MTQRGPVLALYDSWLSWNGLTGNDMGLNTKLHPVIVRHVIYISVSPNIRRAQLLDFNLYVRVVRGMDFPLEGTECLGIVDVQRIPDTILEEA